MLHPAQSGCVRPYRRELDVPGREIQTIAEKVVAMAE